MIPHFSCLRSKSKQGIWGLAGPSLDAETEQFYWSNYLNTWDTHREYRRNHTDPQSSNRSTVDTLKYLLMRCLGNCDVPKSWRTMSWYCEHVLSWEGPSYEHGPALLPTAWPPPFDNPAAAASVSRSSKLAPWWGTVRPTWVGCLSIERVGVADTNGWVLYCLSTERNSRKCSSCSYNRNSGPSSGSSTPEGMRKHHSNGSRLRLLPIRGTVLL